MKNNLKIFGLLFMFILVIVGAVWFDIHRWNTFQDVTNSEVGYFKWKFLIDTKGR